MSESWSITTLGEITEVITKGTTPTSVGFDFVDRGVIFVKVESIGPSGQFIRDKFAHIDENCHAALRRSQLASGDILYSIAGALGRTARVTPDILPANTNQALAIVRLKKSDDILPEFVLYALSPSLVRDQIEKQRGGVAQQNLSLNQLAGFRIPLPPFPEQQHIVAILDEAFSGLATAAANAEKNLQNALELFESYRHAVFDVSDSEWKRCKLDEICQFMSGGTPSKTNAAYWRGIIPWVSGKDMKSDRIGDAVLHISPEAVEESATRIAPVGSLLILVRGMGLANGIALAEVISPCAFNQDIKALQPRSEINSRFLLHSLRAAFARSKKLLSNAAHGTLKVEMDELRNIPLRIPSLRVQEDIASKMESLAVESQNLVRLYRQKVDELQELKQSLLQKAFSGELTSPPSQAIREAAE